MKNKLLTWVTTLVVAIVMVLGGTTAVFADESGDTYIGVKTEAKVYDDFENDIWLQFQHKKINVNEEIRIYPRRVPQIIESDWGSGSSRPVFNFEIIKGDSVELSDASGDAAIAAGKKEGTSIIKVTYNASSFYGGSQGAISPVNTGYVVITVGENSGPAIESSIDDWKHYDTVYYAEGKTVDYDISVKAENAEEVKVTCNGIEIAGSDGSYTLPLENRANIIGIEATDENGNTAATYRIIDARFIDIMVNNKTNPGENPVEGDTVNISFSGITMPVYKLIGIYNPEWTDSEWGNISTRVTYSNSELGEFEGECTQWDLAANNDFDVTVEKAGIYTFHSDKGIFSAWWGSDLGKDLDPEETFRYYKNDTYDSRGYFSSLPDFTITVLKADNVINDDSDKGDVTKDNGQTAGAAKDDVTDTGDDFNMLLLSGIALLALAGIAVVVFVRRRRA